MKKLLLFIVFLVAVATSGAQKVYFIYIQSENASPFFVKMNDKVQSSTASGYVILSSLRDSTYNFSIGFPGKQEENKFSVTINKEDRGFLLKPADNGWGLFDLQSLVFYRSTAGATQPKINVDELMAQADPFTKLLAQAADDPSLLLPAAAANDKTPAVLAKADLPVKNEINPGIKNSDQKDSTTLGTTVQVNTSTEKMADTLVTANPAITPPSPDSIAAVARSKPEETTSILPDSQQIIAKTVPVSTQNDSSLVIQTQATEKIPDSLKSNVASETTSTRNSDLPVKQATSPEVRPDSEKAEYKRSLVTRRSESSTTEGFGLVFLDKQDTETDTIRLLIPNPKVIARVHPVEKASLQTNAENIAAIDEVTKDSLVVKEKQCSAIATEKDFLAARKSMAAEESDSDMIRVAEKYFLEKCFSTEQVKNLSALFLTPSGKFDFFNAAYAHTSDRSAFASLGTELKDDYYAGRFRDLVGGR
jgi:hypothetical protein